MTSEFLKASELNIQKEIIKPQNPQICGRGSTNEDNMGGFSQQRVFLLKQFSLLHGFHIPSKTGGTIKRKN